MLWKVIRRLAKKGNDMNRRQRLEHLEQHNPLVFHREVEAFANGEMVLTKDNIEEAIERMYADADASDARWTDGTPVVTNEIGMVTV